MNTPLVSVIIPNYNYGRFLAETIDSVLLQTYPNIEIIVVDDGSTDNSEDVLRSYGEKIKWFKQANKGVAEARNRAVAESAGEMLAFLDSDDVWLPEKIEKQIEIFQSDASVGLVHCGYVDFDNEGKLLEEHLDGIAGEVTEEMIRYRRAVVLGGGSAAIIRREVFSAVGGFDQTVAPAEDWEFYFQTARRYKIGFVPEVLMKYRQHGGNNHLNIKRMERAILGAYNKVFSEDDFEFKDIKNACYGRIHTVLAGSYFQAGDYPNFIRQTFKALWLAPENISQFANFPFRRAKRLIVGKL